MTHPEKEFNYSNLVAIIGAGTMGRGIAEVALSAGHPVVIYNHREITLHATEAAIRANSARRVEKGRISKAESEAELALLHLSTDLSAIRDAFIVIEMIAEDIDLKRQVLIDIEGAISKDAILATNTAHTPQDVEAFLSAIRAVWSDVAAEAAE